MFNKFNQNDQVPDLTRNEFIVFCKSCGNQNLPQDDITKATNSIKHYQKQPESLESFLDLIATDSDRFVRFYSAQGLIEWVKSDFEFNQDQIDQIMNLLIEKYNENESLQERHDFAEILNVMAYFTCLSPNYLSILNNFNAFSQINFLINFIVAIHSEYFQTRRKSSELRSILIENKEVLINLILQAPVFSAWFRLIQTIFNNFDDDVPVYMEAFLKRTDSFTEEFYPEVFGVIEEFLKFDLGYEYDELITLVIQYAISVCTDETETALKSSKHVISFLADYSFEYYDTHIDVFISIAESSIALLHHYDELCDDLINNVLNMASSFQHLETHAELLEYRKAYIDAIANFFTEYPFLIDSKFDHPLSVLQSSNFPEIRLELLKFYEDRFDNITFGLVYVASFVQDWMLEKTDVYNIFLKQILALPEIPASSMKFIKLLNRLNMQDCVNEEMIPTYINISISFFEQTPLDTCQFLKLFLEKFKEKCKEYLNDLINFFVPYLSSSEVNIKKYIYAILISLADLHGEDAEQFLQNIGSDILNTISEAMNTDNPKEVIESLKMFDFIITNQRNEAGPTCLKFFNNLAASYVSLVQPILMFESDDLQSQLATVFHSFITMKWITESDFQFVIEYSLSALATKPIKEHMSLLIDTLPYSFIPDVTSLLTQINVNGDAELVDEFVRFLTNFLVNNSVNFWEQISPEFILHLLESDNPSILEESLDLCKQILLSDSLPEGFNASLIEFIMQRFNSNFSEKRVRHKFFEILMAKKESVPIAIDQFLSIVGDNNDYAEQIKAELSRESPNRNVISTNMWKLLQNYELEQQQHK
ncbi:hypothetical protein TVAG_491890 [Trichomonas vaginalis G3]|uniref:Uncharacterized protein n=1 Tax=Trichomonas vaginalis (strain ATCC PRA-98 / G3) TaxID=412133 RepID=A2EAM0_TRIV3|nr:armadillo (ARM) repeat-containing protein family [Trichomonas vaginalis G3]EAY10331.1 hypothetical protein TVAG_491890 [Trichomonas vaginalis G3]KAI5491047.1 armadillo (ARM) repeat-containing protein family [Trichomonas vaginalis G3]|eukprot:XP_001322554.1 hypothetical protein [Trichomonas vaginalis G3]